eukprot:1918945-Rhodomonas_salina.1
MRHERVGGVRHHGSAEGESAWCCSREHCAPTSLHFTPSASTRHHRVTEGEGGLCWTESSGS